MTAYRAGMVWGESPRWHGGALWLSDTQGSKLWTDVSGAWVPSELDSPSNGLWFLPDGRLVGAISAERRIGLWDGGRFQTYAELPNAVGPLGDMVGDASGNLYVDDVGYVLGKEQPRPGQILRVAPDGAVTVAAAGIEFPNGLALIEDGNTLVVAETWAKRLRAFSVQPDGSLTDSRVYANLEELVDPEARPDGIWAAPGGAVWAACLTAKCVALVTADGLVGSLATGNKLPIACCSDGDSQLFVTVADTHGLPLADALAARLVSTEVVVFPV